MSVLIKILMEWLLFLFLFRKRNIPICTLLILLVVDGRRFVNDLDGGNIHAIIWVEREIHVVVDHEF